MSGGPAAGIVRIGPASRLRTPPWLRAVAVGVALVAVLAAFLMFGPVGLGNGPLTAPPSTNFYSWRDPAMWPAVYVVPLINSAGTPAQIDSVTVRPAAGYPAMHVLRVRTGRYVGSDCFTFGPVSSLTGCVQAGLALASGSIVAPRAGDIDRQLHGPALVIELAAPPPAQCSVISAIVLHYHVGIRHYSATVPQGTVAVCGTLARLPAS